jgi:hypothetical protein
MHARAAYIRSFGTTGILLVASLLMLAMVGAVVGFHRWPGGSVVQNVPSVPLNPTSTSHLREVRATTAVPGVHKATTSRAARAARARKSTAGLVKVAPVSSPDAVGYAVAITPGHVGPQATTPANSGSGNPAPQPRPPAPPSAPPAPQPIQQLVDEIIQAVPPPPQRGQPIRVHLPLAGMPAISTPPLP